MLAGSGGEAPANGRAAVDDATLREQVMLAVRRLGMPIRGGFDVIVQNGVVHLWGEVDDQQAYAACANAAAEVSGVRDVLGHMQVRAASRRPGVYRR